MFMRERKTGNWAWYPFDHDAGILWCQEWFKGHTIHPKDNPIFRFNRKEQYLNIGPLIICWGEGSSSCF